MFSQMPQTPCIYVLDIYKCFIGKRFRSSQCIVCCQFNWKFPSRNSGRSFSHAQINADALIIRYYRRQSLDNFFSTCHFRTRKFSRRYSFLKFIYKGVIRISVNNKFSNIRSRVYYLVIFSIPLFHVILR